MRTFDTNSEHKAVVDYAVKALKEVFPIAGKQRTIKASRIWVEDTIDPTDFAGQMAAKRREGTWGLPVYADLTLQEKGGKVIDRANKVKLMTLPRITPRNSYIVKGNEYQVSNQLRLKPGVYTIRKQNGELKTQVNLAKGKNFDLVFDERKGKFIIEKVGGGQAKIPLYPVLVSLGISHQAIAKEWGEKIADANRGDDYFKAVSRAEKAFGVKTNLADHLTKKHTA